MLLGLRGVGKTVLINRLRACADDKGFETAKIEAPEGGALPDLLAPELRRILYALDLRQGRWAAPAASGERTARLRERVQGQDRRHRVQRRAPHPVQGDSGNLEQGSAAPVDGRGGSRRRAALGRRTCSLTRFNTSRRGSSAAVVVACHEIAQRNLPLLFIGAGLPQVAALAGKAKSYAERLFDYPEVGPLDPDAARAAIEIPARNEEISFRCTAPSMQSFRRPRTTPISSRSGDSRCGIAHRPARSRREVVADATPDVIAHLDANFFRVRFDRLTVLQQKYLRAMAELGPGPHKTGHIATTLGVGAASVATVRQQLVNKGMVWSQRRGETAFTAPLFDSFTKRQMPILEKHVPVRRQRDTSRAVPS